MRSSSSCGGALRPLGRPHKIPLEQFADRGGGDTAVAGMSQRAAP
jgi:hypothetical protein